MLSHRDTVEWIPVHFGHRGSAFPAISVADILSLEFWLNNTGIVSETCEGSAVWVRSEGARTLVASDVDVDSGW